MPAVQAARAAGLRVIVVCPQRSLAKQRWRQLAAVLGADAVGQLWAAMDGLPSPDLPGASSGSSAGSSASPAPRPGVLVASIEVLNVSALLFFCTRFATYRRGHK